MPSWCKSVTFEVVIHLAMVALVFWGGYHYRDILAQRDAAAMHDAVATEAQQAAVKHVDDSNASQAGAAVIEAKRVQDQAAQDANTKIIYRDIVRYVDKNPSPTVCDLDADGMRVWNASNTGTPTPPEPDHSTDADGAVSAGHGATPDAR